MIWLWIGVAGAWNIVDQSGACTGCGCWSHEILLTTRVGVMRTTPDIESWERDARFPPDTKRVATWAIKTESGDVRSGAWGAPPTQALGNRCLREKIGSAISAIGCL